MAKIVNQAQHVTHQPSISVATANPFHASTGEWSVGLYDCCNDMSECGYAYFCSFCFMNALAQDINEASTCGCLIPSRVAVYRMKIRSILRIQGSAMDDCCVGSMCGFCAAVQMKMELKSRGLTA